MCVLQLWKIWSTENHLRFDWKISHFERKIIYALILPSNNFWKPHLKRELEHTPYMVQNPSPSSPQPSSNQPSQAPASPDRAAPRSKTHLQAYLQTISKKKKKNRTKRERERGWSLSKSEREPPIVRERDWSPELEIDSIVVWAVPLTADLPCFSPPPSATHVTNLPFFSLPMSSKPLQDKRPTVTQSPPPRDLASAASRSNPIASLSLFLLLSI